MNWIYDIIAVVAVAVSVWLSGRQGVFKGGICAVGCIIGLLAGFSMSGSVADSLYKTTVRDGIINKIDKTLVDTDISAELTDALETMGYSVIVKKEKIDSILTSDDGEDIDSLIYKYMNNINGKKIDNEVRFYENLSVCYAKVTEKIISGDVSKYAVEISAKRISEGKADFGSVAKMIKDGDKRSEATRVIADDFVAEAYKNVIKLVVFVILIAILMLIAILTARAVGGGRSPSDESSVSHITGGLCGLLTGVAMVCVVSAFVGLHDITANSAVNFFDNPDVDKTYIFKYAYDFLMKR